MGSYYDTTPVYSRSQTLWFPTGAVAETFPRNVVRIENLGPLSTGRLHLCGGAVIPGGATCSNITFVSATTALAAGTNQWFCLVNAATLAVLAKTADDTSTAWSANTAKTLALSATYTPAESVAVYIGIMVAAGTVPTLLSASTASANGAVASIAPIIAGSSTTGLTTPASLGATAGAISGTNINAYAYIT
jgi:hypothetical protein